MSPERKCTVNGCKVEEFYWAGRYPVYVDNKLAEGTYEEVVSRLEDEERAAIAKARGE